MNDDVWDVEAEEGIIEKWGPESQGCSLMKWDDIRESL